MRTRAVLNRTYHGDNLGKSEQNLLSYSIEQEASIVADCSRVAPGKGPGEGQGSSADDRRVIPFLPAVK